MDKREVSLTRSVKQRQNNYTGIVVEMCTASAVSATLILRNIWGPWLDDGPSDVDKGTEPKVEPNTALPGPPIPSIDRLSA